MELKVAIFEAERKPDVIAIQEAKPKNAKVPWNPLWHKIDGYSTEGSNMNPEDPGRGLLLYIREEVDYEPLNLKSEFTDWQAIRIRTNEGNLTLASVYRSPSSTDYANGELNRLLNILSDSAGSGKLIICGDFNYPRIKWNVEATSIDEDTKENSFVETLRDCYLSQHIDQQTRVTEQTQPSLLDLLLCDITSAPSSIQYCNPIGKSDHVLIRADFVVSNDEQSNKVRPNFKKANYVEMREAITKNWSQVTCETNVDLAWNKFKEEMQALINRYVPKVKVRGSKCRPPLDAETLSLLHRKNKMWKRYLKDKSKIRYRAYTQARNHLRQSTRAAAIRQDFEVSLEIKKNPKAFWNHINRRLTNKESIPRLQKPDGTFTDNDEEKAQTLSEFFASVFTIEPTYEDQPIPTPSSTFPNEICFSIERVRKEVERLNVAKSGGPDSIPPRILHETRDFICEPLCHIFQLSWDAGRLPTEWKEADISAIFKKGKKSDPDNYRPVSLTSVCCKIMEKIIRHEIISYLETNGILDDRQYGFLAGRSTQLQLLNAMDRWTESLDMGKDTDVIYLDFRKAFDSVPQQRLLSKLKAMGFLGNSFEWIRDFLTGRKQRVVVNGKRSAWTDVTSGIPQGSVLGPILFLTHINTIAENIKSEILLFADDAKLFRRIDSAEDKKILQDDLKCLENWSRESLLRFHENKCAYLPISNNNVLPATEYTLNDVILNVSNSEKDLGVWIDNRLDFDRHIVTKVQKANGIIALVRKCFSKITLETFNTIYKSIIRPHLEYCNQVWHPYMRKHVNLIENVQRRATRLVSQLRDLDYESRLRELNLPTLAYRRKRGTMIEMFKLTNQLYNSNASDRLFELNPRISRGNQTKVVTKMGRLQSRRNCFTVRAATDWNNLPEEVTSSPTLNIFKRRLDRHWAHLHTTS